jgi:serine/threonine protein kinase
VTRCQTTIPLAPKHTLGTHLGAFHLVAPIARGGTAAVYLAEHTVTRVRVAIKVLDPFFIHHPEVVEQLLSEHAVFECVRHPAMVEIMQTGHSETGLPYLVMEYLDGETVHALDSRSELTLDAVIAIAAQVAEALAAMHEAGFIHCDVKPDNVCVLAEPDFDGRPSVKLFDFGVARSVHTPPSTDSTIAGTPAFMAPEQWRGAPNQKSDVYALGCTMYELVTGQPVFSGTLPQLMRAHCERLPERPSTHRAEIPAELERIIVRSLAKDPAMRPTMAELELELRKLVTVATPVALHAVG